MDYTEFKKYVEENTRAQGKFLEKATVYLLDKNASRKPAAKWTESYNMNFNLTVERKHFGVAGEPGVPEFGVI